MTRKFILGLLIAWITLMITACGETGVTGEDDGITSDNTAGEMGGVEGVDPAGHTSAETGDDLGGVGGAGGAGETGADSGGVAADATADLDDTTGSFGNDGIEGGAIADITGNTEGAADGAGNVLGDPNVSGQSSTGMTGTVMESPVTIGNVTLTQTISSEDGALAIQYPDGWTAQSLLGQIVVSNSQSAFHPSGMVTPEAGETAISIFANTAPPVAADQEITPTSVLTQFTGQMSTQQETTLSEPQEFMIQNRTAASVSGTQGSRDLTMIAVRDENGNYIIAVQTGASGTADQYTEVLHAILASALYNPEAAVTPSAPLDQGGTEQGQATSEATSAGQGTGTTGQPQPVPATLQPTPQGGG